MALSGILFTLVFCACLLLALFRHPRYGVLAYLLAFYFHPPSRWWGVGLPDLRWSLLASVVTAIALLSRARSSSQPGWLSTAPARIMVCFTALIWLRNLWALDPEANLSLSILYTKYLMLFYFIYRTADNLEDVEWFLVAHMLGCGYLGALAFGSPVMGRLDGVGGPGIDDSNTLSMHLATGAICGAMIVLVRRDWRFYAGAISVALSLNGLVLCGSRGAFLAVVCGGVVLTLMRPVEYRRRFNLFAVLGVTMFLSIASATFWDRMNTIRAAVDDSQEMDNSAESRFVIIQAQAKMAATHPLGTGHRGTAALSTEYIPPEYLETLANGMKGQRSSHNTFMTALVEHSIIGAGMFIMLILWCRASARRISKKIGSASPELRAYLAAIVGSLVTIVAAGLFADFIAVEVQFWMLAILASLDGISRRSASTADLVSSLKIVNGPPGR